MSYHMIRDRSMYIETALSALQRYLVDPSDASTLFVDESVFKLTTADKRQIRSMIREAGADRIRNVTKGERVVYQQDPRIFSGPDEMYLRYLFAPESIVRGAPPRVRTGMLPADVRSPNCAERLAHKRGKGQHSLGGRAGASSAEPSVAARLARNLHGGAYAEDFISRSAPTVLVRAQPL